MMGSYAALREWSRDVTDHQAQARAPDCVESFMFAGAHRRESRPRTRRFQLSTAALCDRFFDPYVTLSAAWNQQHRPPVSEVPGRMQSGQRALTECQARSPAGAVRCLLVPGGSGLA